MERTKILETSSPPNWPRRLGWTAFILAAVIIGGGSFLGLPGPLSAAAFQSPTPTPQPTNTPTSRPSSTPPPPTQTPNPPTATITSSVTPPPPSVTPSPPNPQVIGSSVQGRPIEAYRFGSGPEEKLIVAGIHGGYEWNTIQLAEEIIQRLQENPGLIPSDVTLYIIPSLNPDGENRSRGIHGRANANGVDLNRNFPAFWQKKWPLDGCWSYLPISSGTSPSSEPETRALMKFIQAHQFQALISYHSAALGIFPGGQPPDAQSASLAEAVASVSTYPYPPLTLGCKFTGQLIDWSSEQGIPSLDIELTNHQDTDLDQNLKILSVFLTWTPDP